MRFLTKPLRLWNAIVVFGLIFSATVHASGPRTDLKTWSDIYNLAKPRIPLIYTSGRICSGAIVESNLVITASHCVNTFREVLLFWNDDYEHPFKGWVVAIDKKSDLALLRLNFELDVEPLFINSRDREPKVGDEMVTIGHPASSRGFDFPPFEIDSTYLISKGVVSRTNSETLISDISVSPGNSGGPAINSMGDIIGIASRKRIDRGVGNISYFTPALKISEFLEANRNSQKPLPFWLGSTTIDLNFWFNHWLGDRFNDVDGSSNSEFEISVLFWDRLFMSSSFWVSGDLKHKPNYLIGWKWQSMDNRLSTWTLIPGLFKWENENGTNHSGLWFQLEHNVLPIQFRYSFSKWNDEDIQSFGIGIRIF